MKRNILTAVAALVVILGIFSVMRNKEKNEADSTLPEVIPIDHASLVLAWSGKTLYADPVGVEKFSGQSSPDIILVTDIHEDHFDQEALRTFAQERTIIVAPQAVADQLAAELRSKVTVIQNGETKEVAGFTVEAIPAYNLPDAANANFHTRGRGNGYVIEKDGIRVYISGDTAGTPEMRALKDIDIAFVCMNLPYTMDVEEAADAVLEFKPKQVYPYHYRTPEGFSDVAKFKELVGRGDPDIEVVELDWYK